jgi:hypothetical protein
MDDYDYNPDYSGEETQKLLADLGITVPAVSGFDEDALLPSDAHRRASPAPRQQQSNFSSHERYSPDPATSDARSGVSSRPLPAAKTTAVSTRNVESYISLEEDDYRFYPTSLSLGTSARLDADVDPQQDTVNALYSELEAMQDTFRELTGAMKASESEKEAMFLKLQMATAKMQTAIRNASMSQARSSSRRSEKPSVVSVGTEMTVVGDFEEAPPGSAPLILQPRSTNEKDTLRSVSSTEKFSSASSIAPDNGEVGPVAGDAERGVAQWRHDDALRRISALETALAEAETERATLQVDLVASEKKRERQRALIRENDERIASLMAALAEAPIASTSSSTGVDLDGLARQKMIFAATEEKLWQVINFRGKQLQHVSRLLASVEARNVELAKLMDRFSKNLEREVVLRTTAGDANHSAAAAQKPSSSASLLQPSSSSHSQFATASRPATLARSLGSISVSSSGATIVGGHAPGQPKSAQQPRMRF